MLNVKIVDNEDTAVKVGKFLTSEYTFDQIWAPNEKVIVEQAVIDSVGRDNHRYWYIEDQGRVVAALGVRENKYGSDGYEMDSDYVAVRRDYRNRGLATLLLEQMESFVKDRNGRYIHVLTCDIPSYEAARRFYEKHGYKKVGEMPDYYVVGEGRIDYFKEL